MTWSRGGRLIDDSFHVLSVNGTVRNEITFRTVDREFLHAELTCTATNTNLTRPVTTTVHVDMNCKSRACYLRAKENQPLLRYLVVVQ